MGVRVVAAWATLLALHACGGSEFEDSGTGGAAGSAASGGTSATGGSGGTSASGGTSGSGGTGATAGMAGSGGTAGAAGGDASVDGDASSDAGPGPITIVQASPLKLTMSPTQASDITLSAAPQAGNAIIVGVTCISDHGVDADAGMNGDCLLSAGTVTDNQSNTYTQVVQSSPIKSSQQAARGYIFVAQPIAAPSGSFTITVDPEGTSTVQGIAWGVIEVAGLSAAPSLDVTGYSAAASGTNTTAATFQPTTQANELAVAVLSIRHNEVYAGIVPDSSWNSHHLHQDNLNGPPAHSMVSKVLSATGTASHAWNHVQPSRGAAGVIATFKGALQN